MWPYDHMQPQNVASVSQNVLDGPCQVAYRPHTVADMNTEMTRLEKAVTEEIRAELARKEWSQARLAQEVGVGREAMNRYIKGRTPIPFGTVMDISNAFGLGDTGLIYRAEQQLPE